MFLTAVAHHIKAGRVQSQDKKMTRGREFFIDSRPIQLTESILFSARHHRQLIEVDCPIYPMLYFETTFYHLCSPSKQ